MIQQLFFTNTDERLKVIRSCIDAEDFKSVADIVHQISGTAGSIGMADVGCLAGRIEKLIRENGDKAEIIQCTADLEQLYQIERQKAAHLGATMH